MKPNPKIACALLIGALLAACAEEPEERPPSVILISIDTLRADALGCYGYERDTSPVLDRFAAESVRFEQAIVQSTATPSSHAAMLTGVNPTVLKLGAKFPENEQELDPQTASYGYGLIDDLTPTLQSRLREAGFRTAGFTAHEAWLGPKNGFHTGFDHFQTGYLSAPENLARIEAWLENDSTRPAFLFIHFYDVHSDFADLPYRAPPPHFGRFSSGYQGSFDGLGEDGLKASTLLQQMFKQQRRFEEAEIRYIRDLYDDGVAYMDAQMQHLFDLLKRHGLYDDALVIVTSDHGEEFQEHGGLLHYQYFDEILRVPLLIRFPGGRFGGTLVSTQVRTVDIGQTALAACGLDPISMSQGVALQPLIQAAAEGVEWNASVGASLSFDGWKVAYRTDQYKFYGRWEERGLLYDLAADPNELSDISEEQSELAQQLRNRMLKQLKAGRVRGAQLAEERKRAGRGTQQFSEEDLRRLGELGYTNK